MIHSFIKNHWEKRSLLSFLFLPIAIIFSLISKIRRLLFRLKIFKSYISKSKIISVGNLAVGGSGKTPFTIFLAKFLQSKGKKVAVSHRGYKGKFEKQIKLISDENSIFDFAKDAGDEPFMMAKNLSGIPVVVGKNRKQAIEILEKKCAPDFIILDDSFQNFSVKHNIDFLLFNAENPFGNRFVIPSGMLREEINSIKFADILILNNSNKNFEIPQKIIKFQKPIFQTEYKIQNFVNFHTNDKNEAKYFLKKNLFLISGIGNPKSFENSIKNQKIHFSHHFIFPDHHKFDYEKEIKPIIQKAIAEGIDAIITTEKDFVKLKDLSSSAIEFYFAKLNVKIKNMNEFEKIKF